MDALDRKILAELQCDGRMTSCSRGSGVEHPAGQVDLVAVGVGEGPRLGCVGVADHVAAGGERGRDAFLDLVVGQVDGAMATEEILARLHALDESP